MNSFCSALNLLYLCIKLKIKEMEKEKNGVLYKIRSYSACFKKGFELYTNNFKLLFKYLWISLLIYAIFLTVVAQLYPTMIQGLQYGTTGFVAILIYTICGILIGIATASLVNGQVFTLFSKYKELGYLPDTNFKAHKKEFIHYYWRSVKTYLWMIPYSLVVVGITCLLLASLTMMTGKTDSFVLKIFFAVIIIAIFFCAFIPLAYFNIKYMMEDGIGYIKMMRNSFHIAMRHWGSIFVLAVITTIVVMIAVLIVNLPDYIIIIVNKLSSSAIVDGDPSGLPGSFGFFSSLVFLVCSFLQIFINIFMLFPFFFLYGSIEAEEKERAEIANEKESEDGVNLASLNTKE
jgi:hypothetical protein